MLEIDPQNIGLKELYQMGYFPYYIENNKLVVAENVLRRSSLVILLHHSKNYLYDNLF